MAAGRTAHRAWVQALCTRADRERPGARCDRRAARPARVLGASAGLRDAAAAHPRATGVARLGESSVRQGRRACRWRHPGCAARAVRRGAARGRVQPPEDALRASSRRRDPRAASWSWSARAARRRRVRAALIALPGIGPWTAEVYLLSALRRPDTWPVGDIALQEATRRALGSTRARRHWSWRRSASGGGRTARLRRGCSGTCISASRECDSSSRRYEEDTGWRSRS